MNKYFNSGDKSLVSSSDRKLVTIFYLNAHCFIYQIRDITYGENGIWVPNKQGMPIHFALGEVMRDENMHIWSKEEIDMQVKSGPFNSSYWQELSNVSQSIRLEPSHRSPEPSIRAKVQPTHPCTPEMISTQLQFQQELAVKETIKNMSVPSALRLIDQDNKQVLPVDRPRRNSLAQSVKLHDHEYISIHNSNSLPRTPIQTYLQQSYPQPQLRPQR
ncbi:hypothetical protein GcM1_222076 [Golovinomyces cichoracearum]|uniref:Uncharacterized protein n=1 Tax=Golovinomyces cichoracearum TaxID=62708 RepID=A0A420IRI6_9PEZI|nr:hypothetical protein GcM1_222076 [Golovinomyces cichoracearum]